MLEKLKADLVTYKNELQAVRQKQQEYQKQMVQLAQYELKLTGAIAALEDILKQPLPSNNGEAVEVAAGAPD